MKPHNILLTINNLGDHIYKLTDFGLAKCWKNPTGTVNPGINKEISSLVGTRDYVDIDILQRIFEKRMGPSFLPELDLWSYGVTFYQLATGSLPFQIKDLKGLKYILQKKSDEDIAIIEDGGDVYFQKTLPDTCQLSFHLRSLLEKMFRKLFQIDKNRNYGSMENFFEASDFITGNLYVNIVNVNKFELIEFIMKPTDKLEK